MSVKRRRGVVLTPAGKQLLLDRIRELEDKEGKKFSLENLGTIARLDPHTVARILDTKASVDKRSIRQLFFGLGLELGIDESNYIVPKSETLQSGTKTDLLKKKSAWNEWRRDHPKEEVILRGVELVGVDLSETKLDHINLERANLVGGKLNNASLQNIKLSHSILVGADLANTNLFEVDLRGSSLVGGNLSGVSLQTVNLNRADLTGADLDGAILRNVNLTQAVLTGATLIKASLENINLSGADLSGVDLSKAHLTNVNFDGANLAGSYLSRSFFENVNFRNTNCIDSDMSKSAFVEVNFEETNLNRADLSESNLTKVKLISVQALETNFSYTELTGICLKDWNINSKTKLDGVICDYIYLDDGDDGYEQRYPADLSKTFKPGEFTELLQDSLVRFDLIFRDDLDWETFLLSFQNLQVKYENHDVKIQAIERKTNGSLVIRIAVPPDILKGEIETDFKQKYEEQLRLLEDEYRFQIEAKDKEIEIYRQQNTQMMDLARLLASKPTYIDVKSTPMESTDPLGEN